MGEITDKAPLLLQRGCRLIFSVRAKGIPGEITDEGFERICETARGLLDREGGVYVDLHMSYEGVAVNDAALDREGRKRIRMASWEITATDAVYCPAGRSELGAQESDAAHAGAKPRAEA